MAAEECWRCKQKIAYQKEKKQRAYDEAKIIANEQKQTMVIYQEGTLWKYCKSGDEPKQATNVSFISKHL